MGSRDWPCAVALALSTAIPALVACGDGDASGGGGTGGGGSKTIDPTSYCDQWAEQCPSEAGSDYSWCATDCEQGQDFNQEDCWSTYCAVETGRCYTDGEQTADNEAVKACRDQHEAAGDPGW